MSELETIGKALGPAAFMAPVIIWLWNDWKEKTRRLEAAHAAQVQTLQEERTREKAECARERESLTERCETQERRIAELEAEVRAVLVEATREARLFAAAAEKLQRKSSTPVPGDLAAVMPPASTGNPKR